MLTIMLASGSHILGNYKFKRLIHMITTIYTLHPALTKSLRKQVVSVYVSQRLG